MQMKFRQRILVSFFLVSVGYLPAVHSVSLPEPVIPNGLGAEIWIYKPYNLDMIKEAGFSFIRVEMNWGSIEREKGVYDFTGSGFDELFEGCFKRNIRVLCCLAYSGRLYESDNSVRTELGREKFADFAEAAAKRYAGNGILWELWNEPNLFIFWSPQPSFEDYCKLVEVTAPRIRKRDPSGIIVAGASSSIGNVWLEECFKRGMLNLIDALSMHPYRLGTPPETVVSDYRAVRNTMKQYLPAGKTIPLISSEWGYPLIDWDKTAQYSEMEQARYLVRMFLANLYDTIPVSIWFSWNNYMEDQTEGDFTYGVVTIDQKPKPAFFAVKTMTQTLKGYSITHRIDTGCDGDFILHLRKDDHNAYAFWTMGNDHETYLPVDAGEGALVDILGNGHAISWSDKGLQVALSPNPQYLIIKE